MMTVPSLVVQVAMVMVTNDYLDFEGSLTIAETEFEFQLEFLIPVDHYQHSIETRKIKECREVIRIIIKKGGRVIPLENDEFNFFYHLLIQNAFRMHHEWMELDEEEREEDEGGQSGSEYRLEFHSEAINVISRPKFECSILDDKMVPKKRCH